MRLMADEARAMAHEAREQSSSICRSFDHIKDVVITVDEDGVNSDIQPTASAFSARGGRGGGTAHRPADPEDRRPTKPSPRRCIRLAASTGDTAIDLASRECVGQRKDGEFFSGRDRCQQGEASRREVFVLPAGHHGPPRV